MDIKFLGALYAPVLYSLWDFYFIVMYSIILHYYPRDV